MDSDLVRRLPKTDLHVHLHGSLRLGSLVELARERKVALPSETPEGLEALVFRPRYASLAEYLEGFRYTVGVLQDAEALERAAYELAAACAGRRRRSTPGRRSRRARSRRSPRASCSAPCASSVPSSRSASGASSRRCP